MKAKYLVLNKGLNIVSMQKICSIKVVSVTLILLFNGILCSLSAQMSCNDFMEYVVSKDYGTSYYSSNSDAITKVSFHEIRDDSYNTYYYAVVQFTSSYKKYIYQVDSSTKFNYSLNYLSSAGEAFWKYIHPYRKVLGCAPNFE